MIYMAYEQSSCELLRRESYKSGVTHALQLMRMSKALQALRFSGVVSGAILIDNIDRPKDNVTGLNKLI